MALVQPLGLVSDQNTKFEPLVGMVDSEFVKHLPPICNLVHLTAWVYMPYNVKKYSLPCPPTPGPKPPKLGQLAQNTKFEPYSPTRRGSRGYVLS